MKKGMRWTGWTVVLAFALFMTGCGNSGGAASDEDGGDDTSSGNTITGQGSGNGFSEPFYSEGCEVQLSMTHADNSRFLLFILDKTDGSAFKTIVYTSSLNGEIQEFELPEGDYWIEVETSGGWSVSITGCVTTYLDPDDYETDNGLYIGCPPPCCEDNDGVFGCDCVAGHCICNDDTLSDCTCECVGGSGGGGGSGTPSGGETTEE